MLIKGLIHFDCRSALLCYAKVNSGRLSITGFVAQIGRRACYPFPQMDLAYWLSDGYAKSSVAVEDGDTDLDLCDLPIKVPRDQRLAE